MRVATLTSWSRSRSAAALSKSAKPDLSSGTRQPKRAQWIHRCATHLSPNETDGDSRNDGNNDGSGNCNRNGKDTAAHVPVQTWNKSPIVSVSRCSHSFSRSPVLALYLTPGALFVD